MRRSVCLSNLDSLFVLRKVITVSRVLTVLLDRHLITALLDILPNSLVFCTIHIVSITLRSTMLPASTIRQYSIDHRDRE